MKKVRVTLVMATSVSLLLGAGGSAAWAETSGYDITADDVQSPGFVDVQEPTTIGALGDVESPNPNTFLAVEGGAAGPTYCEPGYHYQITRNLRNYMSAKYRGQSINDSSIPVQATWKAGSSKTYTFGTSVEVSASAKAAIFAEIKGSVRASADYSYHTEVNAETSAQVPPHSTLYADFGPVVEWVRGESYYLTSTCTRTQRVLTTGRAGYREAWHTYE